MLKEIIIQNLLEARNNLQKMQPLNDTEKEFLAFLIEKLDQIIEDIPTIHEKTSSIS